MSADTTFAQIKDIISRLQSPVRDLHSLLSLLAAPLASIKILPPQFITHNVSPSPALALSISKHFPPLQRALLQYILPTWEAALLEENSYSIVQQYFCPDLIFFSTANVTEIAILAYSTILSLPLTEYSARLLVQLTKTYPVDVLWSVVVQGKRRDADKQMVTWEDCIRNVCAVPGKAANVFGTKGDMPRELEHARDFYRKWVSIP
ncbi:hypothetical protein PHLCEN_2v5026 [Hermanssonia centrifuga]|uniref:Uncharacterized protein n=1 Tax=Hermanssonia centrifuga TaxID=98765 RepID=A0A2R6PC88_9APHY|nr:hypothetical protein PHLCEN_2v5026 [Hermanssonia centrifuga]